ncbi:MAG: mechanosensitive ion channel family protein [Candidatus Humimicrobiia bacterium]
MNEILQRLSPISSEKAIKILIIIIGAILFTLLARLIINQFTKSRFYKDLFKKTAPKRRLKTFTMITKNSLTTLVVLTSLFLIFDILLEPKELTTILASAGIIGVILGFGAQSVIKDVINGIFILFENQYVIGDSVKIGDIAGTIEDITLRVTSIRDIEGHLHFIPNGEVKTVSNRSRQWSRVILDVGVPYNEDLKKAFKLLNEIGKEISEDENYKNYIITPIRVLGITEFGESSVIIRVWGKVKPGKNFPINREFRKRLIEKAGQLKLKIPYPKKAIILKQE